MYEKIILPNGVRIVTDPMPGFRSAAIGLWVGAGSRYESAGENGAAHFIEHMLFKGTEKYTASELAAVMDSIGGQINAFTTRDSTCFYARVLDTHLDTAAQLLADMFFHSRFDPADIDSERNVILEEIHMYDDSPEDLVVERLLSKCFKGALGRPVCGTARSLAGLDRAALRRFMTEKYVPERLVIALSGSFTQENVQHIAQLFSPLPAGGSCSARKCQYTPAFTVKRKASEQNHLCLGFPGVCTTASSRYAVSLMSQILGGGMSSRLFQSVRERRGLCYSIYTFSNSFDETGFFGIATALSQDTELQALALIQEELRRFLEDGVTPEELSRAREQAKSSLVMGLESTSSRMSKLGFWELAAGSCPSTDERLAAYDAVTREDVLNIAWEILDFNRMSFSVVGRTRPREIYAAALEKK